MFNNGLAAIVKDGTYDKIINKYLDNNKSKEKSSTNVPDETTIVGLIKNNYKQLLQGLGITLGFDPSFICYCHDYRYYLRYDGSCTKQEPFV